MTTSAAAALINLLGFVTGSVLYAMLLAMVLGGPRTTTAVGTNSSQAPDRLALLAAVLGLAWNLGAFATIGLHNLGVEHSFPLLVAAAFTALGFLPAVVVHSVLRAGDGIRARPAAWWMTMAAYALSMVASGLHFYQAVTANTAPAHWALHALTIGFSALIIALLIFTRRQPGWRRAGWVVALAVFAVSALHLSHHDGENYPWWIELVGHHASLLLAAVILYQDYRFALADIFLKRALALVLLVALAFGLYLTVAAPLLEARTAQGEADPFAIGLLLGLWVVTALLYPWLRRMVVWFVDAVVLRRADYHALRDELAQLIAQYESPEAILNEVCQRLEETLTATEVRWTVLESQESNPAGSSSGPLLPLINRPKGRLSSSRLTGSVPRLANQLQYPPHQQSHQVTATVLVPTTDPPQYHLLIGELSGGRRLLSDDLALLETVAIMVARRIDAVRVIHERCVRDLHEQEMNKLATEAELRALRAQVNPHFLFNALTTIGYLIQTAPDRALETLLRLTALLRAVLRHSDGEFATLGAEIELIKSYLDIEQARFEERLRVVIDVPSALRNIRIPALLVQPLVENAIKHGISPCRTGGEVVVLARLARANTKEPLLDDTLQIWVRDTGVGVSEQELEYGRRRGVGLQNVERRLKCHYGEWASFGIRSAPGIGTTVEISLPIGLTNISLEAAGAAAAEAERRRA
jgi:two-component system LytT family sensor kinase